MNTEFIPFDASRMDEAISYRTYGGDVVTQVTKFDVDQTYCVKGVVESDAAIREWTVKGEHQRGYEGTGDLLMKIKQEIKFPCLCWVSDHEKRPTSKSPMTVITNLVVGLSYPYEDSKVAYKYATPLTDEELAQFGLKRAEG